MRNLLFGLALILAGIGWYETRFRWASTRKWEPLGIPVSLAPGHIHTPEFEINTQSTYRIAFVARRGFGHSPGPSDPPVYQYCLPDLGTSWSLSNGGHVVVRGTGQRCDWLGGFEAGDGRYVLDVNISHDGSQFNPLDPRLAIFEVGGVKEAAGAQVVVAFWGCFVLTILGTGIIICSELTRRHEALNSILRAWPLTQRGSQLPPIARLGERPRVIATRRRIVGDFLLGDRRSSARYPLTNLSSTALIAGITFLWTFAALSLLEGAIHLIPTGLTIHLLRIRPTQMVSGIQPLLVRVEVAASGRPRLYVDYQPIGWKDFDAVLQKGLSRRPPKWPVYVEGDPGMEWKSAVDIIDRIRGLHAEVILLTSRSAPREQTETGGATPANTLQKGRP